MDVIVVGGGLAGTLLALELERRGRRVLLVDDDLRDAATPVAAGLLNPVTGMRLSPTPGAALLIPAAIETFRSLEQKFGRTIFRALPLFRAYSNEAERDLKRRRAAEPDAARWFGDEVAPEAVHPALHAPLGGFMIVGGGWVDLPALLAGAREHFTQADAPPAPGAPGESPPGVTLLTTRFDHAGVEILKKGAGVRWRGVTAKHLVFAEGAGVRANPWFRDLAWQPAKGEFITCETDLAGGPDFALKIGLMAIPLGDGRWRVGSNYEWEKLDTAPTPAVRDMLLAGFAKMFRTPPRATVVTHLAGVRPAAKGARPIVGRHPDHPALHVFNGFGAKGCTWTPAYAREYAARLD